MGRQEVLGQAPPPPPSSRAFTPLLTLKSTKLRSAERAGVRFWQSVARRCGVLRNGAALSAVVVFFPQGQVFKGGSFFYRVFNAFKSSEVQGFALPLPNKKALTFSHPSLFEQPRKCSSVGSLGVGPSSLIVPFRGLKAAPPPSRPAKPATPRARCWSPQGKFRPR